MQPLTYGVISVKFAVYCVIKLRPTFCTKLLVILIQSLKMASFIILTGRCHVDVFWTGFSAS